MEICLRKIFRNQLSWFTKKGKRIGRKRFVLGFMVSWEFIKQFKGEEARYYEQMAFCNPKPCMAYWVSKDIIHMWLRQKNNFECLGPVINDLYIQYTCGKKRIKYKYFWIKHNI